MPDRLEIADVSCPANVPATAPVEVALPWYGGKVRRIHVVIPAGHAGKTGIALGFGHQPVLPFGAGAFLSGDDDVERFDYNDKMPGASWSAFLCNTDQQRHSWQVRFELDETGGERESRVVPVIDPATIIAVGNAALQGA